MVFATIPSRSINLSAKLRFPMIRFRYGAREQHQKPEAAAGASAAPAGQAQAKQTAEAIYDFQLPLRLQRRPLSEEEIEFINRGGPA